ncbi:MAG: septation protein SpoVG family protein [Defluviitaleaceae bacterium]|nr:septation protein SpoVG family protein [Defluviitaleaceae bacterium]
MTQPQQFQIDVKINPILSPKNSTLAFANITINNLIAINGVRVMSGAKGNFVAMPQSKGSDGKYYDIAFPATAELRKAIDRAVLEGFNAQKGMEGQNQTLGQTNQSSSTAEQQTLANTSLHQTPQQTNPEHIHHTQSQIQSQAEQSSTSSTPLQHEQTAPLSNSDQHEQTAPQPNPNQNNHSTQDPWDDALWSYEQQISQYSKQSQSKEYPYYPDHSNYPDYPSHSSIQPQPAQPNPKNDTQPRQEPNQEQIQQPKQEQKSSHNNTGTVSSKTNSKTNSKVNDKFVSEARRDEARSVCVLDYIKTNEPDNITRHSADTYKLKDHDSLKIFPSKDGGYAWKWHSRDISGKTALDFMSKVRGYNFVDAVKYLTPNYAETVKSNQSQTTHSGQPQHTPKSNVDSNLNQAPKPQEPHPPEPPEPKGPIELPKASWGRTAVTDYLTENRAIDEDIVNYCFEQKVLYQSKPHNNAVFVGFDQDGVAKYASLRGTKDNTDKKFIGEATNSTKSVPFVIPIKEQHKDISKIVFVTESPIDAMSKATLDKQNPKIGQHWNCVHRISLGGTSSLGLETYLKQHPNIDKIVLNLDNDKAGQDAAHRIMSQLNQKYPDKYTVEYKPPQVGVIRDWNDISNPDTRPIKDFNDVLVDKRNTARYGGAGISSGTDEGRYTDNYKDNDKGNDRTTNTSFHPPALVSHNMAFYNINNDVYSVTYEGSRNNNGLLDYSIQKFEPKDPAELTRVKELINPDALAKQAQLREPNNLRRHHENIAEKLVFAKGWSDKHHVTTNTVDHSIPFKMGRDYKKFNKEFNKQINKAEQMGFGKQNQQDKGLSAPTPNTPPPPELSGR